MRRYETELEEDREMVTESKQFSGRVLDGSLSRLTGLITTGAERNLVVFNPLARLRTDVVRVAAGRLPERFVLTDAAAGADVACQRLPDGEVIFLATDVPPTGYKTYSVSPETAEPAAASPPSSAAQRPVVLENSFYRVEFDEAAGAITGLRDKQLGVELVDRTAPHKFNEYLYERFETPDVNQPSTWHRVQSAEVRAVRGPVADVVTVTAAPAGVESMRQTITLYHGLNRIDFRLEIVKSPSGRTAAVPRTSVLNRESLYLALPFAVPEGRFHHELAGGVVEPIRDQFVGSCTAHYAVRHFADVSNRRYGVTLATVEAPLVEYGRPRSRPVTGRGALGEDAFEKVVQYPANSRMYLYLLNNMFDTNIRWDQAGPMSFSYFLRSHQGDWRSGKADEFGWAVHCPLLAVPVRGKRRGLLPASAGLLAVDPPHVVCTVVKPAEWNGSGLILRLVETRGLPANATVFLPFFGPIASATETDLVENDRPAPLELKGPAQFALGMRPFGVKTVRVLSSRPRPAAVQHLVASPVSDMEVALSWQADAAAEKDTSHYHVYRGTTAGFRPTLLNLVERPTAASCTDRPQLNYGGWINNRLEPETTYYYRVAAVDRWNSEGPLSAAVAATTLKSSQGRRTPLRVECLRAVCVSPLAPFRFVNLLFRTNCEPDVVRYEIFRSTQPGFAQDDSKLIGTVEADAVIKGSTEYGHTPVDHRVREFDHAMYEDDSALPETTYYYCVRAVDRAGRKGPASLEAQVRIGR
jgi:hypothetical protein